LLASVKESIRLFAQQGIRLFSAKGKVQLQAQDNDMELIAKRVVDIISTQEWVNFKSPTGIRLQSGPTELTITPAGFKVTTPGYDHVYAGDHQTFAGASAAQTVVSTPQLLNEQFVLRDKKGNPVAGYPFKVTLSNGRVVRGTTDALGRTPRIGGTEAVNLRIEPDVQ